MLAIAGFGLFMLTAFVVHVLVFVRPLAVLPRWMAVEIRTGRADLARPERSDWVIFWMVTTLFIVSGIGLILVAASKWIGG